MDFEGTTHKQDPTFRFTYDQKPAPDEKRRHIPLQGQQVRKYCFNIPSFILIDPPLIQYTLFLSQALFIQNKQYMVKISPGLHIATTVMSHLV
jgi:hypothetical protein